jgi:hypothetical protein
MGLKTYIPGSGGSSTSLRGVITQSDTDGGLQGYSWAAETNEDADVLPSDDFDIFQPYGFSALVPKDTEYVGQDSNTGPCATGFRVECPVTLAVGESAHWYDANCYAHAKSGEYIAEATTIKVGKNATKAVALDQDECTISAALATWMTNVQTSLNTLGQPVAALVGTAIATVAATATKAKAE